jgi:PKD repeat protein
MKKIVLSFVFALIGASTFAAGHTVSISSTNVTCYGGNDGSATANVSGGVGPFAYYWSPMGATTAIITGLSAGTYSVDVTDQSDMSTTSAIFTITHPPALAVSLPPSTTLCNGTCFTFSPSTTGGVFPYTYSWAPATGLSFPMISSPTACPTTTTTYTLTVVDAYGCAATTTSTVILNINTLSVTTTSTNTSSCGACDGSATAIPSGGTPPYVYSWAPGAATTVVCPGVCALNYTVTVTDANGCMDSQVATVSEPTINSNFTMVPDSANAYAFTPFNTTAGSGLTYFWNYGDGTSSALASPPAHIYGAPGTYTVCLAASSFLCSNTRCETVVVTGTSSPCLALFNIATDTNSSNPNAFTVYNLSYGAGLSYLWDFGDGNTSTQQNPAHIYASNGNYLLCLTVNNGSGCSQTYCDSLLGADSLSRTFNPLTLTVVNGPGQPIITNINEVSFNSSVAVSPNPFSDATIFAINSEKTNGVYTFELFDVLGKKVMEQTNITAKQFSIGRNNLENGMYFYKIYTAESVVGVGKVIVK